MHFILIINRRFCNRNTIRNSGQSPPWIQAVWQQLHIPKCSFLLWMALKNRLYTRDRLLNFGLNVDPRCVLCNVGHEYISNIFCECNYFKVVLHDAVLGGNRLNYMNGNFFSNGNVSKARKCLAFLFIFATYSLWRERNDRIHKAGHAKSAVQVMVRENVWRVDLGL